MPKVCSMMKDLKLVFLVTAWLVHVKVFCYPDSPGYSETDIKSMYDRISEEMLSAMKTSNWPANRQKRDLVYGRQSQPLIDDSGVHRLISVKPVAELCYPAIRTLFLDVLNNTYAVCVTNPPENESTQAEVIVGLYRDHAWTETLRWVVYKPKDVAAFYFKRNIYVIVADAALERGAELVKINLKAKRKVTVYTPHSKYPTSIAIWKMKNTFNMAIANSLGPESAADLRSEVFVYEWKDTYFGRYASFPAYDVKDIEPFHIHGAHYIAVANFRKDRHILEVDSEILRYDFDMEKNNWKSYQKIRTYGAMDWEFFTLGTDLNRDFFLAVANNDGGPKGKSMIYKFVDDKFRPFQCLQTIKATSIATYSSESTFVLAIANDDDAVHLYQYDGWMFVKSIQLTSGTMSDGVKHLYFHRVVHNNKNAVILSVSNPRKYGESVYEMEFKHENTLENWHEKSTNWCLKELSKLENIDIDNSIGNFKDLIFTDQSTITIDGDIVFEKGFEVDTLRTPKLTEISTEEVYDTTILIKLADLQKRLKVVQEKLTGFDAVLRNSLRVDVDQNITSKLHFEDAVFDCKSNTCHFDNIYADVLNGEEISHWSDQLVFLDDDHIKGTLHVNEINATDINVHGSVDGVLSKNLVTKSGNHPITGHKTFEDSITASNIHVSGEVDGVIISSDNVLLTTGHQTTYGHLIFDDLQTTWLKAEQVNGRNLSDFYNDLVLADKHYTIEGKKAFEDITVHELFMNPGSKINGVNLVDLWQNALWVDENQDVTAEITFSDVMLNKGLTVPHGINGIRIPGERVVDITEPTVIAAATEFQNPTKISNLKVLESLNGRPLVPATDGSKQLDILMKSGDQVVTGVKTFHTMHLDADSYVDGTVGGVDLSDFKASVLRKNSSIVTNETWVFNNLVVKGPLSVKGKISGLDLKDVYERALKLNDTEVPEMIFNEKITVGDLRSNDINNVDIKRDLVLVNEFQEISGTKVFNDLVLEEDTIINGFVNNMNLSFFNDVLLKVGDQSLKSKVFKQNVFINDLTVTGSINGVPVKDIVTLEGGQIFGSRMLKNVSFIKIEAKNVEVTGKVNNIDLNEMINDTMLYDGPQAVTGMKEFKGTIFVMNGSNLQTRDLNGIDLDELWADAVFVDIPEQIMGEKVFEENVVFGSLSFDKTLDGVCHWDMQHNWMLKNAPQTIQARVIFKNGLSAKDLIVGELNGIDLEHLDSEIVKVNEKTEIEGPIIFEGSVISNGNIGLTGNIQGVDLSEEAVTRNNVIVTSEKKFVNDLVIESDLTVDGTIDGIDIEELCGKALLGNKKQNISRLVIKGDVTFAEGGSVGGRLAGVDLRLLEEMAVNKDGSLITFTGLKKFSNVTFEGPVTVMGRIGNVDLDVLAKNYMSLTKPQEILAKMEFDHLAFKGVVSAENINTVDQEINGINLQQLNNRILKTSGVQTITAVYHIDEVVFENDVFVAGKVNGLELPSGLMRHNRTNYIQSPKIFEKAIVVRGDLEMEAGKTIQGVDVSDWSQKAVLKHGRFEIRGSKTFHKLDLNDVMVEGLFDGLTISVDSLLMTYGNQVVVGRKTIVGNVSVEGLLTVNGLINDVNLDHLSKETLQRDGNNNVTGHKHFTKPLTIVSLQASTVAGVDVSELQGKLNTSLSFDILENRLDEIEGALSHMQLAFDNQAVIFQYYELFGEFSISTAYNWLYVSGNDCGELLLLSDNSSSVPRCSSIRIFGYDEKLNNFVPTRQELTTSYAVSVKTLAIGDSTYIFVANQNPHSSCSSTIHIGKQTVDIYIWNEVSFQKIQSLLVHQPFDMVAFKNNGLACLVILEYQDSTVYCSSETHQNFTLQENLFTSGGRKASVINSLEITFLAIAAEDISKPRRNRIEGEKYIDIYMWNTTQAEFSSPTQTLTSTFVQSIALMSYKEKHAETLFLAVAEGSIPKINNEPKIIIYRYSESSKKFQKYQEIKDYGTLEWVALNTGELLFFAVDSLKGKINVYQYKGASGFVKMDTVRSLGTTSLHAFVRTRKEDWLNHYLALVGPRALLAQSSQGQDYAKILKSKVKGKRAFH